MHRAPTDPALVSAGLRLIPFLLNSSSEWLQEHARSAKAFHLREVYLFFHLREVYFLLSLAISPRSKKKKKKKERKKKKKRVKRSLTGETLQYFPLLHKSSIGGLEERVFPAKVFDRRNVYVYFPSYPVVRTSASEGL